VNRVAAVTSGAGAAIVILASAPAVQQSRPAPAQQMAAGERESGGQAESQPTAEARPALAGPPATDTAGGTAAAASSNAVPAGPQAVDAVGDSRQQDGAGMPNGDVDRLAGGKAGRKPGSPRGKGSEVTYRQVRQLLMRGACGKRTFLSAPAHRERLRAPLQTASSHLLLSASEQ
jgi:hypothetical protein